ncbi:MAG TPA: (2Fe-2S)-binding protein [Rhodothermales bacterium]
MIRIDRCICRQKTFAELAAVARRTGARSVAELQQHVDFGTGCGLCRPYVRRMLETGQVVFDEILEEGRDDRGSIES